MYTTSSPWKTRWKPLKVEPVSISPPYPQGEDNAWRLVEKSVFAQMTKCSGPSGVLPLNLMGRARGGAVKEQEQHFWGLGVNLSRGPGLGMWTEGWRCFGALPCPQETLFYPPFTLQTGAEYIGVRSSHIDLLTLPFGLVLPCPWLTPPTLHTLHGFFSPFRPQMSLLQKPAFSFSKRTHSLPCPITLST